MLRQSPNKRHISPPRPFSSPYFVLLYIADEHKYVVISSASTLFPKKKNLNSVKPLEKWTIADGAFSFEAYYLCHSNSEEEIKIKRGRLQRHIDSGKQLDSNTSLRFLNESFCSAGDFEKGTATENNGTTAVETTTATEQEISEIELPVPENVPDITLFDVNSEVFTTLNDKMSTLVSLFEANNEIQSEILKEVSKMKRILHRQLQSETQKPISRVDNLELENSEPVLYNGVDLSRIKPNNLDLTNFSLKVARILWSDEDLKHHRLLPKRAIGKRQESLSPVRTELFKRSVKTRFGEDEDLLATAVAAVNQLGSDISRDKRRRSE